VDVLVHHQIEFGVDFLFPRGDPLALLFEGDLLGSEFFEPLALSELGDRGVRLERYLYGWHQVWSPVAVTTSLTASVQLGQVRYLVDLELVQPESSRPRLRVLIVISDQPLGGIPYSAPSRSSASPHRSQAPLVTTLNVIQPPC